MNAKKKITKDEELKTKVQDGLSENEIKETEIDQPVAEGEDQEEEVGNSQEEIMRLQDKLLRLNADFDNYRKRTLRDKEDFSRYAAQNLVEKMLTVLDGFDAAALAINSAGQEGKSVAEGFIMIAKQLTDILCQEGLAEISALGEEFDPNFHEAVTTAPCAEGQKDNEVIMVLRKGYMYKDKVLRPSMVQVAKDN